VLQPLEGYQVERAGTHAVALNLELDDELVREGLAREVVRAIQNARKEAGLNVEDRITLGLSGADPLIEAARAHQDYIAGEVLATELSTGGADGGVTAEIRGHELQIKLARA
jgi:isoleucyl-tRNA synthetase